MPALHSLIGILVYLTLFFDVYKVSFTSDVTTALCTFLHAHRNAESLVLILGLVSMRVIDGWNRATPREFDNDMADVEGGTGTDGNAPINIKVSSSTYMERRRRSS
jgi:hypothetical protein